MVNPRMRGGNWVRLFSSRGVGRVQREPPFANGADEKVGRFHEHAANDQKRHLSFGCSRCRSLVLYRPVISNGIPPAGRKVTFATGFGLCPATG
jgi:hypothetical protein